MIRKIAALVCALILISFVASALMGCQKSNPVEPQVKKTGPDNSNLKIIVSLNYILYNNHDSDRYVVSDSAWLEINPHDYYHKKCITFKNGETKIFTGDEAAEIRGKEVYMSIKVILAHKDPSIGPNWDALVSRILGGPYPKMLRDSLVLPPDTNKFEAGVYCRLN